MSDSKEQTAPHPVIQGASSMQEKAAGSQLLPHTTRSLLPSPCSPSLLTDISSMLQAPWPMLLDTPFSKLSRSHMLSGEYLEKTLAPRRRPSTRDQLVFRHSIFSE